MEMELDGDVFRYRDPTSKRTWEIPAQTQVKFYDAENNRTGVGPKQHAKATFTTGLNYGRLLTIVELAALPYRTPRATQWRKDLGIKGKGKQPTIEYVEERYPQINLMPGKAKTPQDGIADAVALMDWARQSYSQL